MCLCVLQHITYYFIMHDKVRMLLASLPASRYAIAPQVGPQLAACAGFRVQGLRSEAQASLAGTTAHQEPAARVVCLDWSWQSRRCGVGDGLHGPCLSPTMPCMRMMRYAVEPQAGAGWGR